jgi:hypothetical protein
MAEDFPCGCAEAAAAYPDGVVSGIGCIELVAAIPGDELLVSDGG